MIRPANWPPTNGDAMATFDDGVIDEGLRKQRAERRRERWETAWSVALLAAVFAIAVAAISTACSAHDAAASIGSIHRRILEGR